MTQTFLGSRAQAAPRTTALLGYAVLFFGVLWLYSATLSGNLSVANDSSFYLLHVLNGAPQFSAHHLIYEPFAWVIYEAVRAVTGPMDVMSALKVVSLINSVFGAACATVLLAIFHQRGRLPLAMSMLATLPAAVSFGLWYYSITVEVYVIGIFFLLVAFYILSADHISLTGWLIAGIAVGLGVLGHQIYLLFGAVILVRLMMIDDGWAARLTAAWACIGPAILTALIPYVLVVLFADTVKDGELMHWLMGYAATDREFVQTASGSTVIKAAMGFGRALLGGYYLFAVPELHSQVAKLPGSTVADDAYLAATSSATLARLLLLLTAVLAALLLALIVTAARGWRSLDRSRRLPVVLSLVWLFAFAGFFVFWQPLNPEFWITQMICLWIAVLILVLGATRVRQMCPQRAAHLVAATCLLVLVINWFGTIALTQTPDRDYYQWRLSPIEQQARAGDLALIAAPWPAINLIELFTGIDTIFIHNMDDIASNHLAAIRATLERQGRVYVVYKWVGDKNEIDAAKVAQRLTPLKVQLQEDAERGIAVLTPAS